MKFYKIFLVFMAAIGLLRYPDVFSVAVDRAGPTDWQNYDNIYTERYMGLQQENKEGYDNGSAMKYDTNIKDKRHLLIMHGLVDDNVHPTNAFQLIAALDKEKIRYESRFFPANDHGSGGTETQWEFFDKYLKPEPVSKN
ncbi:MAG: prolyl oligopeptidase family serine peptidase [Bacteroidales bacterium]